MYHLKGFINYTGTKLADNHIVLAYSKREGYCYLTYEKAKRLGYLITGQEKL